MLFIEGIGYVNETSAPINKTNNVQSTNNNFDVILAKETSNLNNTSYNLEAIFKEASEKYGISEDLLKAIGYNESRFQPNATSSAGAMGIMQLMPKTAEALGVNDAYDPYQNIMGAAKLLSKLSDMYDGDTSLMIAAYNAGTGTVAKYGGIPPYDSVNNYIAKIYDTINSGIANNVPMVSYNKSDNDNVISNASNTIINNQNLNTKANYNINSNSNINTNNVNLSNNYINTYYNNNLNILQKTGETETTNIYDYRTGNGLNNILSYSQYDLLLSFYENMLDIISSIGDTDDDNSFSSSYLYNNFLYNKNNINIIKNN